MVEGEHIHPGGEKQLQLLHGELVEHPAQDGLHRLLVQGQAVHRQAGDLVLLGNVRLDGLGPVAVGLGGVEQHHKGLAHGFEFLNDPLLRLQVVLPRDVGDGSIGGHHNANGGVVSDNLLGAQLRRLGHGNLVVHPGGGHHPGLVSVHLPHGSGHHVAHAVNEPHGEGAAVLHGQAHRILRDEFGLGGHHHAAGPALGQLIPGPVPQVGVLDFRQHHSLHKALDEGGFSRANRTNHPNVNIALGALGDILIQFVVIHSNSSSPQVLYMCMGISCIICHRKNRPEKTSSRFQITHVWWE